MSYITYIAARPSVFELSSILSGTGSKGLPVPAIPSHLAIDRRGEVPAEYTKIHALNIWPGYAYAMNSVRMFEYLAVCV